MKGLRSHSDVAPRHRQQAFTILEFLFAVGISGIVLAGMVIFVAMASRSLQGITTQNTVNQDASHASEYILERIRLANTLAVSGGGNTLSLTFDDDPDVDSNGDTKTYNDRDHTEQFQFTNGDGSDTTTDDNKITYNANTSTGTTVDLVPNRVRKLPSTAVFTITNSTQVLVNFGLVDSYSNDLFQALEIKTSAVRRNSTN
jgi:type II secretory pathway pseudopilin PulG